MEESVSVAATSYGPTLWFRAEWIGWSTSGSKLPPLLTTSPAGTPRAQAGVLGQPGTQTVFGDDSEGGEFRSGFRIGAGFNGCGEILRPWFDFFYLSPGNLGSSSDPTNGGTTIVGRPFFNAATGLQDSQIINLPGSVGGNISVGGRSTVWGGGIGIRPALTCWDPCVDPCDPKGRKTPAGKMDLILGYAQLFINDTLDINEILVATDPNGPVAVGTQLTLSDNFRVTNQFHGAQLGLTGEYRVDRGFVEWLAAIAVGPSITTIDISGTTTVTSPAGQTVTYPGGFYALGTNSGHFTKTKFAVMPTLGLKLGWQWCSSFRSYVGYNVTYLSSVIRVGDVIDTTVNPTQLPPGVLVGAPRPMLQTSSSGYWMQGISVGGEFRF